MKKTLVFILALGANLPAWAYWFGTPGFSLRNERSSIQGVYDTGTRSITPKDGGNDIDLDSSRFYVQYARGFGNGLDFFGRLMPQTGNLDFNNMNYNPTIWGLGGGLHYAPAQAGPVHWGGQVSLDWNAGEDRGVKTNITEVAVDGGGSYRANENIDVYGGASLMKSDITVKNNAASAKFDLSNTFGLFAGVGFFPAPNWTLGFEVHLINETVFGFSAAYRFGGAETAPHHATSSPRHHHHSRGQ